MAHNIDYEKLAYLGSYYLHPVPNFYAGYQAWRTEGQGKVASMGVGESGATMEE